MNVSTCAIDRVINGEKFRVFGRTEWWTMLEDGTGRDYVPGDEVEVWASPAEGIGEVFVGIAGELVEVLS